MPEGRLRAAFCFGEGYEADPARCVLSELIAWSNDARCKRNSRIDSTELPMHRAPPNNSPSWQDSCINFRWAREYAPTCTKSDHLELAK
jgi:hypothetical protein